MAAYASQLLVFDEANWYKIDLYDALVWGLVVTLVFSVAVYSSSFRIETVEASLKVFLCLGTIAFGLTVAAIAFLMADAWESNQPLLPILGMSGGYWVAVFVFLVSMFLQMRLAIIGLHALRHVLFRTRYRLQSTDSNISRPHYSMVDIFALTGLVAVSISACQMVLGMVTDRDAMRFVCLFYAATCMAICVYGFELWRFSRTILINLIMAVCIILSFSELYLAQLFGSPFQRFGISGILLWNGTIALSMCLCRTTGRQERTGSTDAH